MDGWEEKVDSFSKKAKYGPLILEGIMEINNHVVIITGACC